MEDWLYWLIEYGKVLLGYGGVMFLWPLVVFRKYLSGKGVTFRFSFCITAQVVLVNTAILLLGLLHILNDWTVRVLFYGILLFSLREYFALTADRRKKIKYLVTGTFGWKNFLLLERRKLIRTLEKSAKRIKEFYKKHWLEYSLLLVVLLYGLVYFSWGVLHDRSYGFSDMYVHHSWIYQLSEGTPFSAGIYPEGMHCVIYAVSALTGISVYSIQLFLGPLNAIAVLLAAYCLMKELFQWRYSGVFALLILLTFGGFNQLSGLARLQCALPQEFGFPATMICCLYLIRYLRSREGLQKTGEKIKWKERKRCWNDTLLLFSCALAATIAIHFYATIMAFFLCFGAALFLWKRILYREHFWPLVTAVLLGVVVAAVPMVAGFVSGIPLQGSLYWGMNIIQESVAEAPEEPSVSQTPEAGEPSPNIPDTGTMETAPSTGTQEQSSQTSVPEEKQPGILERLLQRVSEMAKRLWNMVQRLGSGIYIHGCCSLFSEFFARIQVVLLAGVFLLGIVGAAIYALVEKKKGEKLNRPAWSGYFILVYMTAVYLMAYVSGAIGLPSLVASDRLSFLCGLLAVMLAVVPLDFLFSLAGKGLSERLLHMLSMGIAVMIPVVVVVTGQYHGYLYFELSRYDVSVQVTKEIMEELPENTYTIVSPTEELYQVIGSGYHEELYTFFLRQVQPYYSIPTEYVFVYVEKKPLKYVEYEEGQYVQVHFFDGPEWLAESGKSQKSYSDYSTCPEYYASEISTEAAQEELRIFRKLSDVYKDSASRTSLESKAYEWCEAFQEMYPNEVKVYYEDEYFVCYYWKQNMYKLYNLVVK